MGYTIGKGVWLMTKGFKVTQNCLIDLHLHLDGSVSVSSARELAEIENIELPKSDDELKKQLMVSDDCRNLNEYLDCFELPCRLMQSEASLERAAFNLCNELKRLGLIYAEIRFAPQKHCDKGLNQERAVVSVLNGIKKSGFSAQAILCCMRAAEDNSRENLMTAELAKKYLGKGVCACDLAGAEALFPNERYGYVFERARELELPFTIHSGEALGAESVDTAIELGASRIGHGVRAIENAKTAERLAELKIPIEVCPTSNLNTCVYKNISDMPVSRLMDMGVIVTINSDNMSVSHTDVRRELQLLADELGFGKREIGRLLMNSAEASFLPLELKNDLKNIVGTEFGIL